MRGIGLDEEVEGSRPPVRRPCRAELPGGLPRSRWSMNYQRRNAKRLQLLARTSPVGGGVEGQVLTPFQKQGPSRDQLGVCREHRLAVDCCGSQLAAS